VKKIGYLLLVVAIGGIGYAGYVLRGTFRGGGYAGLYTKANTVAEKSTNEKGEAEIRDAAVNRISQNVVAILELEVRSRDYEKEEVKDPQTGRRDKLYRARFSFPVKLTVTDEAGLALCKQRELVISWTDVARRNLGSPSFRDGWVTEIFWVKLVEFKMKRPGKINAKLRLSPKDPKHKDATCSATLKIHEDVPGQGEATAAMSALIAGGAAFLLGLVLIAISARKTNREAEWRTGERGRR